LIRGKRLVVCIAVVILSEAKNLGLSSELIHNRNKPEMFLPRLRDRHDNALGSVTRTFFE
jgi:hypothetical protein